MLLRLCPLKGMMMTIKTSLVSLVKEKMLRTEGQQELQEFFGYLIDGLNALSVHELEEYYRNSISTSDVLRLVSWQSVEINIEFSECFVDQIVSCCD